MKKISDSEKLRGGYYTPFGIAQFLAAWGVKSSGDTILEPSCGDGNVALEVALRSRALGARRPRLTAFELLPDEAAVARARLQQHGIPSTGIESAEFFSVAEGLLKSGTKFDLVVGNPPFVRYQDFPEEQRQLSFGLMRQLGLNPSRLANAWLPFLAVSSALVSDKGRLGMVIPAELFQVGYAAEVRQFLASYFSRIDIITFDRLVFPGIQQEVVLLLAERAKTRVRGIRIHELNSAESLEGFDVQSLRNQELKPLDHSSEKWTKYFLDSREIGLLREMRGRADVPVLGRFLDIDVGIVTGDNDYFLLDERTANAFRLGVHSIPVVGRSAALPGVQFTQRDLERWAGEGKSARLFLPKRPFSSGVRKYVASGEHRGVHKGYKCRIRKDWFVVPAVWTPDVFFLRQADSAPRIIANTTNATCTDTLHRGRLRGGAAAETLAVAFVNSLTWAVSEVSGRSYGGGVMTYEPSEVERLPLPVSGAESLELPTLDLLIRERKLEDALDLVDRAVLIDSCGISRSDVLALRRIWTKLRDRRRGRKARAKTAAPVQDQVDTTARRDAAHTRLTKLIA